MSNTDESRWLTCTLMIVEMDEKVISLFRFFQKVQFNSLALIFLFGNLFILDEVIVTKEKQKNLSCVGKSILTYIAPL